MNTPRWVAQNEDGTYAVGEGDAEIATCKNREDAMRLKEANAKSVAWLITDYNLNELQIDSIQRLIDRAKRAHMTDIKLRINGKDEWYEADWLKHMTRTSPPQRQPLVIDSQEKASEYIEKTLWEVIDVAAMFPKAKPDPRTWDHLMVYAPQRQWVGLDNDDLVWIYSNSDKVGQAISNTEAKLKEKNT